MMISIMEKIKLGRSCGGYFTYGIRENLTGKVTFKKEWRKCGRTSCHYVACKSILIREKGNAKALR